MAINKVLFEKQLVAKIISSFENEPHLWRFEGAGSWGGGYIWREDDVRLDVGSSSGSLSLNQPYKYNFDPANTKKLYDVFKEFIDKGIEKKENDDLRKLSLFFEIDRGSKMRKINAKAKQRK